MFVNVQFDKVVTLHVRSFVADEVRTSYIAVAVKFMFFDGDKLTSVP